MGNEAMMSRGVSALSQLYGFADGAARFAVEHIEDLKAMDNELANRCGQVLEAASIGFGIGSETALVLIGVGQNLLGNPLTGVLVAPATANPIVLTCAAIGAIHFGWKAMSDSERDALLQTVSAAFEVGTELVRAMTTFAVDTIRSLIATSSACLKELKDDVARAAETFGRSLGDITRSISDRFWEQVQATQAGVQAVAVTARAYIPGASSGKHAPVQVDGLGAD